MVFNMSKATTRYNETANVDHEQSTPQQDLTTAEYHEDSTSPKDAALENAQRFADLHGLTQHIKVLRKAVLVTQGDIPTEDIGLSTTELQALQDENTRKWRQPKMLYFTILVCSIGAVEQGWAQTGMNGANLYFPKAFGIGSNSKHDNFIVGLINSGIYLSAGLLGAWLSDPVNNRLGRRGTVFLGSSLCLVSNLGSSLSRTWPQLLVSRLVLGMGLGLNASTVSVFAVECAPANIRGGLAVSWQMWTGQCQKDIAVSNPLTSPYRFSIRHLHRDRHQCCRLPCESCASYYPMKLADLTVRRCCLALATSGSFHSHYTIACHAVHVS